MRRAAVGCALAAASCISGESVDLGRNMLSADAGARDAGSAGLDAPPELLGATVVAVPAAICAGGCADLTATITGGIDPETYAWDHGLGSGPGPEHVCPTFTTTYSLTVTSGQAQVTASATIAVNECDASVSSPPPPTDAGASDASIGSPALCVDDPSFEGTPAIGTPGGGPTNLAATAAPPGWKVCAGDPDINPLVSAMPASDGLTYIGMTLAPFSTGTESEGTALCAPLEAGQTYPFSIDVAMAGTLSPQLPPPGSTGSTTPSVLPVVLQIWGGRTECGKDELLWTSQDISKPGAWVRFCDAFVPSQPLSYLRLVPAAGSSPFGPGQWSYLLVDHLVPGAVCH
jgi:hypothetical protein